MLMQGYESHADTATPLLTAELASAGHWFDVPEGSALECLAIGGEQQRVYVGTIEPPVEYE